MYISFFLNNSVQVPSQLSRLISDRYVSKSAANYRELCPTARRKISVPGRVYDEWVVIREITQGAV